ncbi:MAG: electron transfer flavoprotein subunit alpha/FixB family protein [Gemmatimonadota bacterium]
MAQILAVLEQRQGTLRKVSLEVLAAARTLADQLGGGATVDGLVFGTGAVEGTAALGKAGADRVLLAAHPDFGLYNPDGFAATTASIGGSYAVIVFPATASGRDLAPRVAAKLGVACATDVTEVGVEGGKVSAVRPVYAGKALQRVVLGGAPAVLSIRPNTFAVAQAADRADAATAALDVPSFTQRVTVKEVKAPAQSTLDVAEASIIVSGGRGLKEPGNFKLIEELAAAFGTAAVGASRAVVDAGWREHAAQVGQTGKTVAPSLYVAVGISGAIQHLAGMRTSKVIVAINKDKDAPIFKVADYGIVGDLFEIVPRLTEEIKKIRAEH